MMQTQPNIILGVILNVIGSACFALMFAYTPWLSALNGEEIYGWRVTLTLPLLTVFIVMKGYWPQVVDIWTRIKRDPYFLFSRLLSALLIGIQIWLFLWGPVNNYALAVSLGYFIMPMTMVLVGQFAFKDRMSRFQKWACLLALVGVTNQLVISQTLSWPTLVVCLGYPLYFWIRVKTRTNHIGGMWFDTMLSLPVSMFFIVRSGDVIQTLTTHGDLIWLIVGLGVISTLALAFQSLSAPHLNLSLFGLLVYVEPFLLTWVAILLGETIAPSEWPTYLAIFSAVFVLMIEGILRMRRPRVH
ncbi:EamA family transporter RarD [Vibrio zhugei]|uniref:EamA family transporter RarD n=1 Tax=Vibrio zhugei TaxID=2479546 RepID=A0ABV7CDC5_9VIBR|nr:EamA family transporter RarD [Vibrio zhugei]